MKTMKRIFSVTLLVMLILSLSVNAFAAKGPRTYTVRVFPGNNGVVSGGAESIDKEIPSTGSSESASIADGSKSLTYNGVTITVSNDKYYIRGLREAGKDGDVYGSNATFPVAQNKDYVVVYGMQGSAVAYTVYYLAQDGVTPMAEVVPDQGVPVSSTGYGPAEDADHRPIVGAYPIDGYEAYAMNAAGQLVRTDNITMTLSADPSANVFTFYYLEVTEQETPAEEPAENPAAEETAAENPAAQDAAAAAGDDAAAAADDAAVAADADADAAGETETVEIGDEEVPLAAPEDILDMDVPLAGPGAGSNGIIPISWTEGPGAIFANHAVMAGIGGGVIVIAVALWFLLRNRKKDEQNAE